MLKFEAIFDEETGLPIRRVTIPLKDRTDAEIQADLDLLFKEVAPAKLRPTGDADEPHKEN